MNRVRRVAAVLGLVAAGGCASLGAAGDTYGTDTDLRAMIVPGGLGYSDALSFQINRPAYTALFRIVPGIGAMMMYPRPGYGSSDGYLYSGMHRVMGSGWASNSLGRRYDALAMNSGNRFGVGGEGGPEFYLLIASERPLQTQRAGLYGNALGFSPYFASMSGFSSMQELVTTVVPDPSSNDYTTDFYVHWPETMYNSPQQGQGLVRVSCNGYTVYVNPQVIDEATRALCERGQAQPNPNPNPADSTRIIEPNRRAPVPAADRLTSAQLQSPERFEAARRAAVEGRTLLLEEEAQREAQEEERRQMIERMRRQGEFGDPDFGAPSQQPRRRPDVGDNSLPPQARDPQPERQRPEPAYEPPPPPRYDPPPEPPRYDPPPFATE